MVDVSDEVLKSARNKLISMADDWEGGVSRGQAWSLDGKNMGIDHGACHSWVTSAFISKCWKNRYGGWDRPFDKEAKDFLVLTCHSKKRSKSICSVEAHDAIAEWIVSDDNPLAKFILNRDDDECIKNGGIIILCGPNGADCSQTMWLCKVLRYAVEGGKSLDVWLELKKNGVNPLLALYVATFVRSFNGATFGYTGMVSHVSVFNDTSDNELSKLLAGKPTTYATSTHAIFVKSNTGGAYGRDNDVRFKKFCAPVKKPDGWGGIVSGDGAMKDDFINRILEWQRSLEKGSGPFGAARKMLDKMPGKNTVYPDIDL